MEHRRFEAQDIDIYFKVGQILATSPLLQGYVHYRCSSANVTNTIVDCLRTKRVVVLTQSELPGGYEDRWVIVYRDDADRIQCIELCAIVKAFDDAWIE